MLGIRLTCRDCCYLICGVVFMPVVCCTVGLVVLGYVCCVVVRVVFCGVVLLFNSVVYS